MGKRPAGSELFYRNMGSTQWEVKVFYSKRRITSHFNRTGTNSSKSSM